MPANYEVTTRREGRKWVGEVTRVDGPGEGVVHTTAKFSSEDEAGRAAQLWF